MPSRVNISLVEQCFFTNATPQSHQQTAIDVPLEIELEKQTRCIWNVVLVTYDGAVGANAPNYSDTPSNESNRSTEPNVVIVSATTVSYL